MLYARRTRSESVSRACPCTKKVARAPLCSSMSSMRAVAFFEGPSSKVSASIGFSGSISYACTTGLDECVGSGTSVGSGVDIGSGEFEASGMFVASGVRMSTMGILSNPGAGTMTENAEQPQRDASADK